MISTLFHIGPLPVRSYGLMMALAFLAAIGLSARRGRAVGMRTDTFIDLGLVSLLVGVVCARVTFIVLDPYSTWRDLPYVWTGGLSFHGGLVGGLVACWLYIRRFRLDFWRLADAIAPGIALGYAIARIGCFLNGCCYGGPTSLPWACRFHGVEGITPPSHPAQLYAAFGSLLVLGLLLVLERRQRASGQLFMAYLALYGVLRFVVEIFRRGYTASELGWGLTAAQVVSLVLILGAGMGAWALERRERRHAKSGPDQSAGERAGRAA